MIAKSCLVLIVTLFLAQATFAQFGRSRVNEYSAQLATEAASVAETAYNNYRRGVRPARNDIEAVMLAKQFSAAAELFNRMVNDRRPTEELRDVFQVLQSTYAAVDRQNLQRARWNNVQRLMSDIDRELIGGTGNNPGFPWPGQGGSQTGMMSWRGTVDDDVRIRIRGGTAEVETIGGTPYYDAATNFTSSLPNRRANVSVTKRRGRGEVFVEQQPSRENNYTAIIRVRDSRGGASQYEIDVNW
ncbi:MAG TPA: hypothetical protein VIT88_07340 [Pyrinomonadaceae bacterium]